MYVYLFVYVCMCACLWVVRACLKLSQHFIGFAVSPAFLRCLPVCYAFIYLHAISPTITVCLSLNLLQPLASLCLCAWSWPENQQQTFQFIFEIWFSHWFFFVFCPLCIFGVILLMCVLTCMHVIHTHTHTDWHTNACLQLNPYLRQRIWICSSIRRFMQPNCNS